MLKNSSGELVAVEWEDALISVAKVLKVCLIQFINCIFIQLNNFFFTIIVKTYTNLLSQFNVCIQTLLNIIFWKPHCSCLSFTWRNKKV